MRQRSQQLQSDLITVVIRQQGTNMENLRLRISCKLIGYAIKLMPKEWRTKQSINNLIATKVIAL